MASNKTNRTEVPEAKAALDRFKTEVASELGVNLKEGYNGDLTSAQAGSIGGEMVKKNDHEAGRTDEKLAIRKKPLHILGIFPRSAVAFLCIIM